VGLVLLAWSCGHRPCVNVRPLDQHALLEPGASPDQGDQVRAV
jgi:hypothetical protein